jgi:cystathionine beta-lyase
LLGDCSLPALRQRTSLKWRTYPDDVLSAFVAEMDYALAGPIKDTVTDAISAGDAGYAHIGRLGEVFAVFAADRVHRPPCRRGAAAPAWRRWL